MLNILISIFAFLLAIFVLVLVHEYGHFWVARRVGVKVLRFSIGFGKRLFGWHDKKGTEYIVALLPLGGYVKMLDEREGEVAPEEVHMAFNRKSVLSRIAIVVAGPFVNVLFAIFLYWLIFVIGFPVIKPVIGSVVSGSMASVAGLQAKDKVIAVDGVPTRDWQAVMMGVVWRVGDKGHLSLSVRPQKNSTTRTHQLALAGWKLDELSPRPIQSLGIIPYRPKIPPVIAGVEAKGSAAAAGLQKGDRIVHVDGSAVDDWVTLVKLIRANPGRSLRLVIQRNGRRQSVVVHVASKREGVRGQIGYLGMWAQRVKWPTDMQYELRLNPLIAAPRAVQEVWRVSIFTCGILGKMIMGKLSLRGLGGPITIYTFASSAFKHGLVTYLGFLAFLSIMLAIINIVPIPGLDGGHLLLYVVEGIIRRPVPEVIQVFAFRLGIVMLITLMLFALLNDIARLF